MDDAALHARVPKLVAGMFIAVGLAIGVLLPLVLQGDTNAFDRVPSLDKAELVTRAMGEKIRLLGRIAERSQPHDNGYVAYECGKEERSGEDIDIRVVRTVTPPLWIEVPGGPVFIANSGYALEGVGWENQSEPGCWKVLGLRIEDPVMVVGTVHGTNDGVGLHADTVTRGTPEEYRTAKRHFQLFAFGFGAIFIVMGGVCWRVFRDF